MIENMLQRYRITDTDSYDRALREIMQEVTLAGLYRSDFFSKAAFYGGTALRIFHGLDRFSEDLDFSLLGVDRKFTLDPFFEAVETEFAALGVSVTIRSKRKSHQSAIESAFLKSDTHKHEIHLRSQGSRPWKTNRQVKIRIEVDTCPPLGFQTEEALLLQPFSFYVKCFALPDLFAGKLHALLYRSWKNRVKGRDWYDFEWYVRHGHSVRLSHLARRAEQSGHLQRESPLDKDRLIRLLQERIDQIDFKQAKEDVAPFVQDPNALAIWSPSYFNDLVNKLAVC